MMNKVILEKAIGRELTDTERKVVEWVNSWERETGLNLMELVFAAREQGFVEGAKQRSDSI